MNFFEARVESVEAGRARVAGAGFRSLDLPATSLTVGDALTIGVRPEHLVQETNGPFAAEGVVELVERLGESSFAHVRRVDDRLFVAEVRGREAPTPGERMTLIAAAQDVHVFDASGQRVSTQSNSWNKFAIAQDRIALCDHGSRGSRLDLRLGIRVLVGLLAHWHSTCRARRATCLATSARSCT